MMIIEQFISSKVMEASRDGERWVVVAEDRYEALVELMEQLGWDLMD